MGLYCEPNVGRLSGPQRPSKMRVTFGTCPKLAWTKQDTSQTGNTPKVTCPNRTGTRQNAPYQKSTAQPGHSVFQDALIIPHIHSTKSTGGQIAGTISMDTPHYTIRDTLVHCNGGKSPLTFPGFVCKISLRVMRSTIRVVFRLAMLLPGIGELRMML